MHTCTCTYVCVRVAKVLASSGGLAHGTPSRQSCRTYDEITSRGAHLILIVYVLWPQYMCHNQITNLVDLIHIFRRLTRALRRGNLTKQ